MVQLKVAGRELTILGKPKFSLTWNTDLGHDGGNQFFKADHDVATFLEQHEKEVSFMACLKLSAILAPDCRVGLLFNFVHCLKHIRQLSLKDLAGEKFTPYILTPFDRARRAEQESLLRPGSETTGNGPKRRKEAPNLNFAPRIVLSGIRAGTRVL